jgi:hypothetical protein
LSEAITDEFIHVTLSMAGCLMTRPDGFEQGLFLQAAVKREWTAGVESASLRRIERTGDISNKNDTRSPTL